MAQALATAVTPEWTLADRLRKAREHAGLKQTELADATGIARSTIVRYEGGEAIPPPPYLESWAIHTGVDLDWLAGEEGRKPRQRKSTFLGMRSAPERPTDTRPKGRPSARTSPGVRRPARVPRPVAGFPSH